MKLKEFLEKTYVETGYGYNETRPRIFCNDGFNISVRKGKHLYCDENSAELGFPSEKDDLIIKYIESDNDPKNSIYTHVPLTIVQQLIDKHGGIDEKETFNNDI